MTTQVSIIVDPLLGNDSTGTPITSGSPNNFYKSVDGSIQALGNITYDELLITVNSGTVQMNSNEYKNVSIQKGNENCELIINGKIDSSILLDSVGLNINTTIVIPVDADRLNFISTPVIKTVNFFFLDPNNNKLNVKDTVVRQFVNHHRVIIETNDPCLLYNKGGSIELSYRDSVLLSGGSIVNLGPFDTINTTDVFCLVEKKDNNVSLAIDGGLGSNWHINIIERDDPNSKIQSKGFFDNIKAAIVTVIFSAGTVASGAIETVTGQWSYNTTQTASRMVEIYAKKTVETPQSTKLRSMGERIKSINKLKFKNSNVKKLVSRITKKVENSVESLSDFTGLYLTNNNPDSIKGYVSDVNFSMINANLVNFELSKSSEVIKNSDYSINLDHSSTLDNGSKFNKITTITKDYTHTLFDGLNFFVDASNNDITINVPMSTLENRTFVYKRTDSTNHQVVITTENGVDEEDGHFLKNKCWNKRLRKYERLGAVTLIGHSAKLWVISRY